MASGILGALAAAVLYGAATIVQAIGVRRAARANGQPLLARAWAGRWYAVGLAMDAVGYVASVVALRTLPLFVVESAIASSVAVTAVLAVLVLRTRLGQRQLGALCAIGVGLVLLAVSATEGHAQPLTPAGEWVLLAFVLLSALLALAGLPRTPSSALVLACASGLGFAGVGIATRVLVFSHPWWQLATSPITWAIVGYGAVAMVAYAVALERGSATTTAALTFTVETVVPSVVGLWLLHDRVRAGFVPLAGVGFVAALAGCIAMARYAEVDPS